MPIDKRSSKEDIIKELMDSYKRTGKIGNTRPQSIKKAQQIASAIAYGIKGECLCDLVPLMKNCINEYTEEPDSFETSSEDAMNKETEQNIDKLYYQQEKQKYKHIEAIDNILKKLKDKGLNIDHIINRKHLSVDIYFYNKASYNLFMASEKNSSRVNSQLKLPLKDNKKPYEKLNKDISGARYLTLYVK